MVTTLTDFVGSRRENSAFRVPSLKACPPEDTATIEFCAEKCKHIPAMCAGRFDDTLGLPAPRCLLRSTTLAGDRFWTGSGSPAPVLNKEAAIVRNEKTRTLVVWVAAQLSRHSSSPTSQRCETLPFLYDTPMMWPEEFEFVVKTMANAHPATYLEWGSGKSTSFYPLLASGQVSVIDGYPPWCDKVQADPTVACMVEEGRLEFVCKAPIRDDGSEIKVLQEGRLPDEMLAADVATIAISYVNAVEDLDHAFFDVALVDGRFRVACALKLLNYLHSNSILFMHDFWVRQQYHVVLEYYDVIGYARSVVALRKKSILPLGFKTVYQQFLTKKDML